jgi:hypothetical protein
MKQLGPHKKYVILAIVIQSIVVVLLGYYLFKVRADKAEKEGDKVKTVFIQPAPEALPWPRLHG